MPAPLKCNSGSIWSLESPGQSACMILVSGPTRDFKGRGSLVGSGRRRGDFDNF